MIDTPLQVNLIFFLRFTVWLAFKTSFRSSSWVLELSSALVFNRSSLCPSYICLTLLSDQLVEIKFCGTCITCVGSFYSPVLGLVFASAAFTSLKKIICALQVSVENKFHQYSFFLTPTLIFFLHFYLLCKLELVRLLRWGYRTGRLIKISLTARTRSPGRVSVPCKVSSKYLFEHRV